jgi:fluoride ion exporter CrcB/FEX
VGIAVVLIGLGIGRGWLWCVSIGLSTVLNHGHAAGRLLVGHMLASVTTGAIIAELASNDTFPRELRPFLIAGLLAGFVGCRSLLQEAASLYRQRRIKAACTYLISSPPLVIGALFSGFFIDQAYFGAGG